MPGRGFFQAWIRSLLAASGCQRGRPPIQTGHPAVDAILHRHGPGAEASLWLGDAQGAPRFEWNATVPRPTASSIKAFYLVEFFAAYADALDQPLPGVDSILHNDRHPAMLVFEDPADRDAIRRVLTGASVRRIGEVMVRGTEEPNLKLWNATYNAAANLVTAALGGPAALTQLIRRRDPAFKDVSVRRYMLADREPGDNEAPAVAFAALYGKLMSRKFLGLVDNVLLAILEVLAQEQDEKLGVHYTKNGDLPTDPQTCVREGCWRGEKETIVYVVMLVQTDRGWKGARTAFEKLLQTAATLRAALIDSARTSAM
jgi:hypothetical protein